MKAQYSVYIYYKNNPKDSRLPQWKKVAATPNPRRAIKCAKLLQSKRQYELVEIKKKSFSKQHKKDVAATYRSYEKNDLLWHRFVATIKSRLSNNNRNEET